jgi:hypothetical protein
MRVLFVLVDTYQCYKEKNISKEKKCFFGVIDVCIFILFRLFKKDDGLENTVYVCLLYFFAVSYLRKKNDDINKYEDVYYLFVR